ncbi:hypothetical protein QEH57_11905 [Pelagicoccus sp. SDUM812005]|nr:hypothetical protein [Pelagicoccus sp. SDUM812005]
MIASAHPEANRLAYRIRTALTGESTGLETAKLAWQQAEAVARANAALQQARQLLADGTLLDCLLLENQYPKLLETARSLDHPLAEAWAKRCQTYGWRLAPPVDTEAVSKIQAAIEEQGELKDWLFKQYRAAVRSKTESARAYQIIELIAARFPDDPNAKEEAAAKRAQMLAQAAADVKDATEQLIPAEPPKAVAHRYLALGLPLADSPDATLASALAQAAAEHAKTLSDKVRAVVDKAQDLSEASNWQEVESAYLACDHTLAINEARGDLPPELRDAFEKVATQLSRIRAKYESSISIRLAIADIRNGADNKGKPVPLPNRVAKLKSLESQTLKTGSQIPPELQAEIKSAYTHARRKRIPLLGGAAAALLLFAGASYFYLQQKEEQETAAALQAEALAALQSTEQTGSTAQVCEALQKWEGQIALAEANSSLANQATLLQDWLALQASLENEYQKSVADLQKLAASPDSLQNAAAIEVLANDIRKARADLAPDRGTQADVQFAALLADYQKRQASDLEQKRRELARVERELRIAANNATQAKSRAEFQRLQTAAETRVQTLNTLLQEDFAAPSRSQLTPLLKSVTQQLSSIETKWAALENAWLQLAQTKELTPYLAQLERIHSFDILPAEQKAALSQTLRLKDSFAQLKSSQNLFATPEAADAFTTGQRYLDTQVELSDEERAYLTRLQGLESFANVYQSTVQYFEGSAEPQNEYRIYLVEPISKSDSQENESSVAFSFKVRGFDEFGNPEPSPREIQFISRADGSFWGFFYKPSTLSPESEYYQRSISNTLSHLLAGANRLAILDQLADLEKQSQLSPAFRVYWQQQFIQFAQLHPWKWGLALSPSLKKHAAQLDKLPSGEENQRLWLSIIEQTVPSPDISILAKKELGELPRKEIAALSKLYQNAANGQYQLAGYVLADGKPDLLKETNPKANLWSVNALTGNIDRIQPGQKLTPYAPILVYTLPGGDTPQKQLEKATFASGLKLAEPPYASLLPPLYQ